MKGIKKNKMLPFSSFYFLIGNRGSSKYDFEDPSTTFLYPSIFDVIEKKSDHGWNVYGQ